MSVAMHGDLYQDVPSQFIAPILDASPKSVEEDSEHEIEIESGSPVKQNCR